MLPASGHCGVGSANGVTFMLEDRDGKGTEYLAEQTDIFVKEANKLPIFDPNNNGGVRSVMSFAVEQKDVRLDEEKCATLGVSISEANSLLQAYMGSLFINYITLYGQQWQVYIQAQGSDRTGTDMLKNFYVKNNTGSSVPLSTLVKITDIKGPEFRCARTCTTHPSSWSRPPRATPTPRPWRRWKKPLRPACPRTWATATQT
ncbi:MAG: efflux RND transporter permease subunit [Akkermansia sp.]